MAVAVLQSVIKDVRVRTYTGCEIKAYHLRKLQNFNNDHTLQSFANFKEFFKMLVITLCEFKYKM